MSKGQHVIHIRVAGESAPVEVTRWSNGSIEVDAGYGCFGRKTALKIANALRQVAESRRKVNGGKPVKYKEHIHGLPAAQSAKLLRQGYEIAKAGAAVDRANSDEECDCIDFSESLGKLVERCGLKYTDAGQVVNGSVDWDEKTRNEILEALFG